MSSSCTFEAAELQRFITPRSDWIDHKGGLDLSTLPLAAVIARHGLNAAILDHSSFSLDDVWDNVQTEQHLLGIFSEVYEAGAMALNLGQCIKAFAIRDMIKSQLP